MSEFLREDDRDWGRRSGGGHYNLRPSVPFIIDPSALRNWINQSDDGNTNTKRRKREKQLHSSWANLSIDYLSTITKHLSLPGFIRMSHICKEWRQFTLTARKSFLASVPPLVVMKANCGKKSLSFYNMLSEERYVTKVLSFVRKVFRGVSGGFLILENCDAVWFVNPLTGENLEFVKPPSELRYCTRVILTKTIPGDEYLVVLLSKPARSIHVSRLSGGDWTMYSFSDQPWHVMDLVVCRGRIFGLLSDGNVGMLILPEATSFKIYQVRGKTKFDYTANFVASDDRHGGQLMAVEFVQPEDLKIFSLDFGLKEWVTVKDLGNNSLFFDRSNMPRLCEARPWGGCNNCFYFLSHRYKTYSIISLSDGKIQKALIKTGNVYPIPVKSVWGWYFPQLADSLDRVWDDGQGIDPRMNCLPDGMTAEEDSWLVIRRNQS